MTVPYYDPDDIDRIAAEFVAYEREQDRIDADARYFLAEVRRDFTAAEIARLIRQPTLPDMEPPDERGLRRLEELAQADPAVLVKLAIDAIWYGGPSATESAETELVELNAMEGPPGRRRAPEYCTDPTHRMTASSNAGDGWRCLLCGGSIVQPGGAS